MFKIQSITISVHDTSFGGFPYVATVKVDINAKDWTKLRNAKGLGSLYGIDIGNAVYKIDSNIPAYNPMVSDRARAKNGVKSITLQYHFKDHDKAEAMGMLTHKFKDGSRAPKYGCHVELYEASQPNVVVTEYQGATALSRIYG